MKIQHKVDDLRSVYGDERAHFHLCALRQAIIKWMDAQNLGQYTGTGQVFYNARAELSAAMKDHLDVAGSADPALVSYYHSLVEKIDEVDAIQWLIDDMRG